MWDSATPFSTSDVSYLSTDVFLGWGDGQIINPPNYGGYTIDKGNLRANSFSPFR